MQFGRFQCAVSEWTLVAQAFAKYREGASRKFRGAPVPLHFSALMGSRLALGAPPSYLLAYQEAGFRYEYCEKSATSHSDVGKTLVEMLRCGSS